MVASNHDADVHSLAKAVLASILPGQVDITLPVETLRFLLTTIVAGFHSQQINRPWMVKAAAEKEATIQQWASSAMSDPTAR